MAALPRRCWARRAGRVACGGRVAICPGSPRVIAQRWLATTESCRMAEPAEEDPLAALKQLLDDGLGLDEPGYVQVLSSGGDAEALQELNAGVPTAGARVAVLSGVATVPSLIERHLIAAGRRGVAVLLPERQQVRNCCYSRL